VEDEPAIRSLISRALQEAGYDVVGMGDEAAGFEAATTAMQPFDLVTTNNRMPRMSGDQMVAQLREHFADLPILHIDDLSTQHSPALPEDVPNLYKPFSIELLLKVVEDLLARAR
jgi:DNA-binding response OmpR family regulator